MQKESGVIPEGVTRGDVLRTGGPMNGDRTETWEGKPPLYPGPRFRDGNYHLLYVETDGTAVYGWEQYQGRKR